MFRKPYTLNAASKNAQKDDKNASSSHQLFQERTKGKKDLYGGTVSRQAAKKELIQDGLMRMSIINEEIDRIIASDSEEMQGPPNTPKSESTDSQDLVYNPVFFAAHKLQEYEKDVDQLEPTSHLGF